MDIDKDFLQFSIDVSMFNDNFHIFANEFNNTEQCDMGTFCFPDKAPLHFTKDNFDFKLMTYDDNYNYEYEKDKEDKIGRNYVKYKGEDIDLVSLEWYETYWFFDDEEMKNNLIVTIDIVPIWDDCSGYIGEDETGMLKWLNTLKNGYFKNKLGKNMIFFVY